MVELDRANVFAVTDAAASNPPLVLVANAKVFSRSPVHPFEHVPPASLRVVSRPYINCLWAVDHACSFFQPFREPSPEFILTGCRNVRHPVCIETTVLILYHPNVGRRRFERGGLFLWSSDPLTECRANLLKGDVNESFGARGQ